MRAAKRTTLLAVALALAGTLVASPVLADVPRFQNVSQRDIKEMDTNKNGRIEKSEYLAAMGAMFDKLAGDKGYCTFQEVTEGMRAVEKFWRFNP